MLENFILKFHHLSDHNEEEPEEDDNPNETDNVPEILRIKGNLFDFETPLCEAYNEFSCLLKIDTDLFTYDIQNFKTYDEYKQELNDDKAKDTEKSWSENGVPYQLYGLNRWWYDELADGKLKDETLALKAKIEGSRGYATLGVLKFCKWLKSCFENFYEIEYEVLVKLQECWWKVNAYEIAPFTQTNTGCTQENQEHKGDPIHEPSNCKVRRFEMMKYLFNDDEEYITIKESEYLNHSKDSLDAYRELLRLINEGWVDLAETMIDDIGSTEFTIYKMMKGSSVWSVRYLVNIEQLMNPLHKGWSIRTSVWSICLGEGEMDAFVVINLSGKVVKYNLISKTNTEIFDIGSNKMDDDDDDDADAVMFIPPFEVFLVKGELYINKNEDTNYKEECRHAYKLDTN
ncbi:hypothetical protein Tco_0836595 [Tanacetum coccineum]